MLSRSRDHVLSLVFCLFKHYHPQATHSLSKLAGEVGGEKEQNNELKLGFLLWGRKATKAFTSSHRCLGGGGWGMSSQSQKDLEQQTAAMCSLGLRRAKSMIKARSRHSGERAHETTRTLKHRFFECSDDFLVPFSRSHKSLEESWFPFLDFHKIPFTQFNSPSLELTFCT